MMRVSFSRGGDDFRLVRHPGWRFASCTLRALVAATMVVLSG